MTSSRTISHFTVLWPVLIAAMMLDGGVLFSQTILKPDAESRLWIEGRSNINRFECIAQEYQARALLPYELKNNSLNDMRDENLDISVKINVREFECGRNRMNQDLYEALKSDEHPNITFVFKKSVTQKVPQKPDGVYQLKVFGELTVAGISKNISFDMKGYLSDNNTMRAVGQKSILMSEYNITPPTGLFGLIKAEDKLTVHFDLHVSRVEGTEKTKSGR
ncbi:MAG: YceI family protein [Balneolaceae bacterium]